MSTFTVSDTHAKPYVSRRRRGRRRSGSGLQIQLSTRTVKGLLGFLVLALLVSLIIIAVSVATPPAGSAVAAYGT